MARRVGRRAGRSCAISWCCHAFLTVLLSGQVARSDEPGRSSNAQAVPRVLDAVQLVDAFPASGGSAANRRDSEPNVRAASHGNAAAAADERVRTVKRASSSRPALKSAVDALPLAKMSAEHRRRVQQIINSASVFRELPTLQLDIDPRVYRFFMDHPDVAVSIWRVMQISEFQMHQTGRDSFETDDGSGTNGIIDVAYRSDNEIVVLCDGVYKSPLLPRPIKASGALHVQAAFERKADGKAVVSHTARLFVSFPSQTVETAARIMSPVSYSIIDQNFREVSLFLHMMSLAMQRQPGWVENMSSQLEGILTSRKAQLMEVTVQVYADANPDYRGNAGGNDGNRRDDREDRGRTHRAGRTAQRDDDSAAPR